MTQQPDLVHRARQALSRLGTFVDHLQRQQLSCGPVTVQQCRTLEALSDGPLDMTRLAERVAIHQSTLTRIVERLEDKGYVARRRSSGNRRSVVVDLTPEGSRLFDQLDAQSTQLVGRVLGVVPEHDREAAVRGMEILTALLDPKNGRVQSLIAECCCSEAFVAASELVKKPEEAS